MIKYTIYEINGWVPSFFLLEIVTQKDYLTEKFYKHFLSELASVLLDVYDSWVKLGTMGVTSRTEVIYAIYKKVIKRHYKL